jgi:hypothetical protein
MLRASIFDDWIDDAAIKIHNRFMGSLKKRRKAKISKHKRRKRMRASRHKKRLRYKA